MNNINSLFSPCAKPSNAEGWSTDSCKNFSGQMIVSNARAFQSTLKMQISDNPLSISIYGRAHTASVYFSMRHTT